MNIRACFLAAAVLMVGGCRSIPETAKKVNEAVKVPEYFTAVFDEGTKVDVYGAFELRDVRFTPCSTFKIVSTLMGLDCHIVHNTGSRLGYDGSQYENPAWNRDLTLEEAFRLSCVPYYKKLTGKLNKDYVQDILDCLEYGNCDISVWNSNGHNVFWIESSLLISPWEKIRVLKKIFSDSSPFKPEHVSMVKVCMKNGSAGPWTIYGKTGTGRNHNRNLLEGWFVGFAENTDGRTVYFAAHGADSKRDVSSPEIRTAVEKILEDMP